MKTAIVLCLSAWLACLPARANEASPAPYDGSWASLQKMPVPAWFDDGKIGIFIHWGPYSVLGYKKGDQGYAEQPSSTTSPKIPSKHPTSTRQTQRKPTSF